MPVLTTYVSPGDKVDIEPIGHKEVAENQKRQYRTKVYDIISDDELKLNMPMEGSKLILLPIGKEYDLCFFTKSGLFQCSAVVKDRYKSNNVFVVTVELTSGLRKFQRREYYRFNCVLDMKCTHVNDEQVTKYNNTVEFLETDFTMSDGTIVDLSGGGIRFLSKERHEKDSHILFTFHLRIGERLTQFTTFGKILTCEELENMPGEYANRVQFVNIDDSDRENIIRYIFEEERKIRKKDSI